MKVWHPNVCEKCGVAGTFKACEACKGVYYCSPECQESDWEEHKKLECEQFSVTLAAQTLAAEWFKTGNFDLTTIPFDMFIKLVQCDLILCGDDGTPYEWGPHGSFGEYHAAKAEVNRLSKIVDNEKREAEVAEVKKKYPDKSEVTFGTFFADSWNIEVKKRGF